MKKSTELAVAAALVFLILASVFFIFSAPKQDFAFSFEQDNVQFVSDVGQPGDLLRGFGSRNSFVVGSEFAQSGSAAFMTEPLTLFNSVLVAQGKFVVTVAKTVDAKKDVAFCDTNDGNKLVNRRMTAQECGQIFDSSPHVVVLVKLPDSSLSKSRVTVLGNGVVIEPNSFPEVSRVSFLVLKTMYADSQDIIDLINSIVGAVKG